MSRIRFGVVAGSLGLMVLGTGTASTQDYPNKPIRIVTGSVGGGSNFTSRLIAQGISGPLGQPVIVDNRGGNIPLEIVSKSPPDGYTLLVEGGSLWIIPLLQNVSYDALRDFSPITLAVNSPNILVVHPSVIAKSVKELIGLAKAKPGELNYSSGSTGSSIHLAAELFKAMAGVKIARISYKGTGPAILGLMAGETQLMFPSAGGVASHMNSGKLRALAVTSAQPSALFPGLPTVAASGLPGYESVDRTGLFAPAKTPAVIVRRLNVEIVRVLNQPDVKAPFFNAGVETVGSSPEEFVSIIKSNMTQMGKVIKDANIGVD